MPKPRPAPVFLDLARIRLPVTALLSIGHRVAGVVMVLVLPFLIYLLQLSLADEAGYARASAVFDHGGVKLLLVLVLWAFFHHLFAGLRFLVLDFAVGLERAAARRSAWLVNIAAVLGALLVWIGVIR
ncbi:MAG TPA: succinate dehydrogenase, cytochrome b556 subunit [Gammaproteobacteria bacterium]|nr:succinate dehydrogenase, cytochrome b556 subunit [Gammaproteobacteria bacterium]